MGVLAHHEQSSLADGMACRLAWDLAKQPLAGVLMTQAHISRTALKRNCWMAIGAGCLIGATCIGLSLSAWAFRVGDSIPTQSFQDQHQQLLQVSTDTESVYVVSSREQGDWMAQILSDQPSEYLATRKAVYLADMSQLPGFVMSLFVLPALRQQHYRLGVVTDEIALTHWQGDDRAVVQYLLKNREVVSIKRHATVESLKQSLGVD